MIRLQTAIFCRIAKWSGLVVCVLIAAAWVLSMGYTIHISSGPRDFSSGDLAISTIREGFIFHTARGATSQWDSLLRHFESESHMWGLISNTGLKRTSPFRLPFARRAGNYLTLGVPCWILLLGSAVPTFAMFRRDRRRRIRPDHCHTCGYNLTGNESGVCPECATPVAGHEKSTA